MVNEINLNTDDEVEQWKGEIQEDEEGEEEEDLFIKAIGNEADTRNNLWYKDFITEHVLNLTQALRPTSTQKRHSTE